MMTIKTARKFSIAIDMAFFVLLTSLVVLNIGSHQMYWSTAVIFLCLAFCAFGRGIFNCFLLLKVGRST